MRSADRVIVAADASKLGRVQLINVAPVSAISVLVTDGSPRHPTVETLRAAGVDVRCVDAAAQRHLTLTADPDGSATVELVELLGPRAIVTVGVGKHRLTSVVGAAALAAIPVGATVRLSARPSEVHRCSVASGERL